MDERIHKMTALDVWSRCLADRFVMAIVVSLAGSFPCMAGCYDRGVAGHQTRFKVHEGEVEDTLTRLVWKRCSFGTNWEGRGGCVGQVAYLGLNEAMALAADGWRVPSGPELESLVDTRCGTPVVDQSIFPDIRADDEGHAKYWTSNATGNAVGGLDLYWNFDFIDGRPDANSQGIPLAVRFVRTAR
jgi:hypothetical protein